jgi:hypothetical protein
VGQQLLIIDLAGNSGRSQDTATIDQILRFQLVVCCVDKNPRTQQRLEDLMVLLTWMEMAADPKTQQLLTKS